MNIDPNLDNTLHPAFDPLADIDDQTLTLDQITNIAHMNLETGPYADLIDDASDLVAYFLSDIDWYNLFTNTAGMITLTLMGELIANWIQSDAAKDQFASEASERQSAYIRDLAAQKIDGQAYRALIENERDLIDMHSDRIDAELTSLIENAYHRLTTIAQSIV